VTASLLALLVSMFPPTGGVSVVPGTGETAADVASFLASRARGAWGDGVMGEGRFEVEVTATSSAACQIVVRGDGVEIAGRVVDLTPRDLGLLEAWVMVRATIERESQAEPTPAIPPSAPVPVPVAISEEKPLETKPEPAVHNDEPSVLTSLLDPDPRMPGEAILGQTDPSALIGPSPNLVDAWGLTLTSQIVGISRGGLAVHARKILLPRVVGTARAGFELATPVTGVSVTRVPLTGMLGWIPFEPIPLELGGFVSLAPMYVSEASTGGFGFEAAVGGYARSSLRLGPVTVLGEMGLGVPMLRHSYTSATGDEINADPPVEMRLTIGLEWRWP